MIYFIQNTRTQAVKIGVSTDPAKRLRALQTAVPDRLVLLGAMPGGRDVEAGLHARFSVNRLGGEWFEWCDALEGLIAERTCSQSNVWDECRRRSQCRYGLGGLKMLHVPSETEFVCGGSKWDAKSKLRLYLDQRRRDDAEPRPAHWPAPTACVGDVDRLYEPRETVPAEECILLVPWPVVCCEPQDS